MGAVPWISGHPLTLPTFGLPDRYPAIRAVTEGESLKVTEIAPDSRSLKHDGTGHAAFIWEWSKEEVNVVVCRVFRNLSATLGLIRT